MTIPKWGPNYMVSFSIKINKMPSNRWTNVLHFIEDGYYAGNYPYDQHGNGLPSVWIYNWWHSVIYIRVCLKRNDCRMFRATLEEKYNITIKQWLHKNGRYYNQLIIPGKRTRRFPNHSFPNYEPNTTTFSNVKCYTSDDYYASFTSDLGIVTNLKIENNEGDLVL